VNSCLERKRNTPAGAAVLRPDAILVGILSTIIVPIGGWCRRRVNRIPSI
jgi:hypothetical protein